jgi:hypothetical protein
MVASGLGSAVEPEGGTVPEGGVPTGVWAEGVKIVPVARTQAKRKFFMEKIILKRRKSAAKLGKNSTQPVG